MQFFNAIFIEMLGHMIKHFVFVEKLGCSPFVTRSGHNSEPGELVSKGTEVSATAETAS